MYLQKGVKRFFCITINLYLFKELEVGNKSISWTNVSNPFNDLGSIGSWFLLKWGTKMIMFLNVFNIND